MSWDDDGFGDNDWQFRSKPIPVPNGIKARTQRGSFGKTWWAGRWIAALEAIVNSRRLSRGRSYARSGQVISMERTSSGIAAQVQGSVTTPYSVSICFQRLLDPEWERIIGALAGQALYAAMLLNGEMPKEIESLFTAAAVTLFPVAKRELITDCTCLDSFTPCKHVAAVHYLLGERFDDDPFLIFSMRGRTREQIIEALGTRRTNIPEARPTLLEARSAQLLGNPLPAHPEAFWRLPETVETLQSPFTEPEMAALPIRNRGKPPFWDGSLDFMETMNETYSAIADFAYRLARDET